MSQIDKFPKLLVFQHALDYVPSLYKYTIDEFGKHIFHVLAAQNLCRYQSNLTSLMFSNKSDLAWKVKHVEKYVT